LLRLTTDGHKVLCGFLLFLQYLLYKMCRLEAEKKDLQEKEDMYCRELLKYADDVVKFKMYMKVMNTVARTTNDVALS